MWRRPSLTLPSPWASGVWSTPPGCDGSRASLYHCEPSNRLLDVARLVWDDDHLLQWSSGASLWSCSFLCSSPCLAFISCPGPLILLLRFLELHASYCPQELSTSDVPGIHPCGSRPRDYCPSKPFSLMTPGFEKHGPIPWHRAFKPSTRQRRKCCLKCQPFGGPSRRPTAKDSPP